MLTVSVKYTQFNVNKIFINVERNVITHVVVKTLLGS